METDRLRAVRRMTVTQRVRLAVNQYEVRAGGEDGELIAFAQQKRLAIKERVTFWTDDSRENVFGGFAERDTLNVAGAFDVTDAGGETVGGFRKDFRKSLFRSTWHLEQPGLGVLTGTERSGRVAVIRRIWQFVPLVDELPVGWAYHFDFRLDGELALSVSRKRTLRDRYLVEIHEPRLDRRLVIAQAVALDAMQAR
ncbi:hypothetical protein RM779_14605 [Streptomyces sp. DSM 41886]|uniref:Uncharacterized protein n=1 Tax=Streptomyces johnsoniae TaxID=3075532 RepID=A0ABU2S6S1_9ACTN|nr:hypothetical protein [Streptomyces sp. DSM 41886]